MAQEMEEDRKILSSQIRGAIKILTLNE